MDSYPQDASLTAGNMAPVENNDDPVDIEQAWATYDEAEAELWAEYAADPTYVAGRMYVAGEALARRRCERAVSRYRYQTDAFKAELAVA